MTTMRASYVPGEWVAVSAPHTWLLLNLPPGHELVTRCWGLLSAGRGVDDLLDALVAPGVRTMPSFALVHLGDDERRAVVRGEARIETMAEDDEAITLTAPPNVPWSEQMLDALIARVVLVGASGESAVELPMSAGVTMAARVLVSADAQPIETLPDAEPPSVSSAGFAHVEQQAPVSETPSEPEGWSVSETPSEPEGWSVSGSLPEPEPEPESEVAPGSQSAPESDADVPSYDFLFGSTQRPPVLDPEHPLPPVPEQEPAAPDTPAPATGETFGWNTMSGLVVDATAEPGYSSLPADPSPDGLIDNVPWGAPVAPPAAQTPQWSPPAVAPPAIWSPPPPQSAVPQSEGVAHTVDRAALRAAMADATSEPLIAGPTVLAGRCPAGHLSPPHAAACRVCGQPMPTQQAFEIPRPPLGVLRLSTGDVVNLDRGVMLGRAPSEPQGTAERPHLVRLASPENDVSRNHAEIVIDGWHVFVRDLGSTNGTTVTLPGQQPVRLRENDLQLLERGAVITLADEVSATFEVSG